MPKKANSNADIPKAHATSLHSRRFDEFLNPKSMVTPAVAGALTTVIANTFYLQFGLPAKWTALLVSVLFATIVAFRLNRCPAWQKGFYILSNTLVVFAVAAGTNTLGDAAQSQRLRASAQWDDPYPKTKPKTGRCQSSPSIGGTDCPGPQSVRGRVFRGKGCLEHCESVALEFGATIAK